MHSDHMSQDYWTKDKYHCRSLEITRRVQCQMAEPDININYLPIDPFNALEYSNVIECFQAFARSLTDWYQNACDITSAAVSDVQTLWIITYGSHLHKGKIVGKLIAYYLVVLTIYIIEGGLWIDMKILKIIVINTLMKLQISKLVVISLGILFSFILTAVLLDGTFMSCKD